VNDLEAFEIARNRIWDELVSLCDAWAQYQYLYVESQERVEMLNATARWFFGLTQRLLIREVILSIARLTDPVRTGRFDNLVLESLLADPMLEGRPEFIADLRERISLVRIAATSIRKHRDKRIAHLDHATAIGNADTVLPGLPRADVQAVITGMGAIYQRHSSMIRNTDRSLELKPLGGAEALTAILEKSDRWLKWKEIAERKRTEQKGSVVRDRNVS
jgi:AbiU2